MKTHQIYLDFAAATPMDEAVLAAMRPYFTEQFYNPSSSYLAAKAVQKDVDAARRTVASWLGAKPAEVIFTAGATEANNLAIQGIMQRYSSANVIVSAIEHEAILSPIQRYPHGICPVDATGMVDQKILREMIDNQTVLLSIGYANNEVGTIQQLPKISSIVQEIRETRQSKGNALPLYLHTDAAQASPYLDLHSARLSVDLMTINGSKIYGPKQVGALFVDSKVILQPQIAGGGQEYGLRSGTENVPGIIGLAVALETVQQHRKEESQRIAKLRDALQKKLLTDFPTAEINGSQKHRLPNNLNISFPGQDGERILMACDERGLQIATGAACSANKQTGSHVLKALQLNEQQANGSVRLTLGRTTTDTDINHAVAILTEVVKQHE